MRKREKEIPLVFVYVCLRIFDMLVHVCMINCVVYACCSGELDVTNLSRISEERL